MLRSYLTTAFRSLRRQKGYAFINVLGLAVGLAASFFILLWIRDELAVDRFHQDGDRIYSVMRNSYYTGSPVFTTTAIAKPLAQVLRDDYPEIQDAVLFSWEQEMLLERGNTRFREKGRHAGTGWFDVFSYPLLAGDPKTVLDDPESIVISEDLAARYFGPNWQLEAVGQPIRVDNRYDATVTGIFQRITGRSSIQFDFILPVEEYIRRNTWVESWGNNGLRLAVRLRPGVDAAVASEKIRDIVNDLRRDNLRNDLFLQRYGDAYLHSDYENGAVVGGRIEYVRIFGIVAIFLLVIASINFMNLATARSARRAREIGVRKSIGATQGRLVFQFLGESTVTAAVAFVLAGAFVVAGLSGFNAITGKALTLGDLGGSTGLWFLAIAVVTGLLAGTYPALYLSSFNVISVLRHGVVRRRGTVGLRKGLVVFQFALSILLLIATLTVYRQIDYIRTKNLGLDRENVLTMTIEGAAYEQYGSFKQALLSQPGIASVTAAEQSPLSVSTSTTDPAWDGKDPDARNLFHIISAEFDFVETLKMDLLQGRSFDESYGADSSNFVINEAAAREMQMDDPVGQRLSMWGDDGQIVGVVRDFHMASMYSAISPTIIRLDDNGPDELFVRTEPGRVDEAIASLRETYAEFNPGLPFVYDFLDDEFEQMYTSELTIGRLANVFSFLAVFIACLGLFGLAAFAAEQRTREIGIRKVLGASVGNLVMLLSRDFITLVVVAFVLSAPIAFYISSSWLKDFTYHTEIAWSIFVLAGAAAVGIAWATVGYQSLRAARANPVKALRTE